MSSGSIAIIGFGNQGRPWAQNLRDSGWSVTLLFRPQSTSASRAKAEGFALDTLDHLSQYPLIAILIPDDQIAAFAKDHLEDFQPGQTLVFAHGYALHFQASIFPKHVNLLLLAPKGIGVKVREEFLAGRGVPCACCVHQAATPDAPVILRSLSQGLGAARAGLYETTVREEVETDLFSEQALLCGGIPGLVQKTFEILVAKGVRPEIAYLECVHELGFMAELFQRRGFHQTLNAASPTAVFGGFQASSRIVDAHTQTTLEHLFDEIHDGRFAKKLSEEAQQSYPSNRIDLQKLECHPLEIVGRGVRNKLYPGESS